MEPEKPKVRINVDRLLKEKGLTKRQLANYLKVSESNVNRKLNDRISIEDLSKIAHFIGCDFQYLIDIGGDTLSVSAESTATDNMLTYKNVKGAQIISPPAADFVALLKKKDEQIDRMLTLIESQQHTIDALAGKVGTAAAV